MHSYVFRAHCKLLHLRGDTRQHSGCGGGGYFGGIGEQSVGDGFPRVLLSGSGRLPGVCAERVRAAGGAMEDCDATGRGATDAVSSRSPQFARFGSSATAHLLRVVRPGISSSSSILVDGTLVSQSERAVPPSAGRCQLTGIGTCAARVSVDLTTPCRIRSVERCFFNFPIPFPRYSYSY